MKKIGSVGLYARNGFGSVGACPRKLAVGKNYAHKGLHYLIESIEYTKWWYGKN